MRPLTAQEPPRPPSCDVPEAHLRDTLRHLVKTGHVVEVRPGHYAALKERNMVTGRLGVNPRGYGFVESPAGDVYVSGRDMHGAMHGDTVTARLFHKERGRGHAGEVVEVTERANERLVGRFEKQGRVGLVSPTDRRIRGDVMVDHAAFGGARDGQIVVVRLTHWPSAGRIAQGEIEEVLGNESDPGVDVEIVVREHGLRTVFPPRSIAAAHAIPERIGELEAGRRDLRDLFTITIDPVDARDFDDAISLERHEGGFRLWVHIADVSHYVGWGDVIDGEAVKRATSVYLVDRVLPMLPERLSNGICSLAPGVDRLTMTVEAELDRTGLSSATSSTPAASAATSAATTRACSAGSIRERLPVDRGRAAAADFRDLAAALGKRRTGRGGLDFESVEPKVWLDEHGKPLQVTLREKTVATNMIEEAMICANEVVARHMAQPTPRWSTASTRTRTRRARAGGGDPVRVRLPHQGSRRGDPAHVPARHRVRGAASRAPAHQLAAAARPQARPLRRLPRQPLRARVRCLLPLHEPIRRYPDLIVHRLLKAQLTGSSPPAPTSEMANELEWLADHCSVMEREAESAENDSVKVKLCELMAEHIGEEWPGIISGVTPHGCYVQLDNTAEGLVHVSAMADDYYRLDAERFLLYGERMGKTWRSARRSPCVSSTWRWLTGASRWSGREPYGGSAHGAGSETARRMTRLRRLGFVR